MAGVFCVLTVCLALSSVLFIIVFCNVGPEKKSHSTCEEETLSRG